ncbi:MAG: hypothetical protein E3J56_15380 [Candidatus Aminicenantes bacterium]|nr:MAG: hypothetical protein E3J56_15380 [Candidatus Aminicenantes bacterium]
MEIIRITKNLAEISVREIMENVVLAFNLSNTDQKNNLQTGGGAGIPSPLSLRSSSEAGRSRCHSLRSFFIPRMHSAPLRVRRILKTGGRSSKPIQTAGEITARIKILPVHQP